MIHNTIRMIIPRKIRNPILFLLYLIFMNEKLGEELLDIFVCSFRTLRSGNGENLAFVQPDSAVTTADVYLYRGFGEIAFNHSFSTTGAASFAFTKRFHCRKIDFESWQFQD